MVLLFLTLPWRKDIKLFQEGDVVQSDWNQSKIWSNEGPSWTNKIYSNPPNLNDVLQATNSV